MAAEFRPVETITDDVAFLLVEVENRLGYLESRRAPSDQTNDVVNDQSDDFGSATVPLDDDEGIDSEPASKPLSPQVQVTEIAWGEYYVRNWCAANKLVIPDNLKVQKKDGDILVRPLAAPRISAKRKKLLLEGGAVEDPGAVIKDARDYFRAHIKLKDERYYGLVSLFPSISFFREVFQSIPLLFINGPHGTGKSTLLEAAGHLCLNSVVSSSFTVPVLGSVIHDSQATILFDEAEELAFASRGDSKLRILRDSYRKNGKRVFKAKGGKGHEVQVVYAPVIIANIHGINDPALADRLITIHTAAADPDDQLQRFDPRAQRKTIEGLQERLTTLVLLYWHEVMDIYRNLHQIPGLSNREFEIWAPVLTMARFFDRYGQGGLGLSPDILSLAKEFKKRKDEDAKEKNEDIRVINAAYLYYVDRRAWRVPEAEYLHITPFLDYLRKQHGLRASRSKVKEVLLSSGVAELSEYRKRNRDFRQQRTLHVGTCYVLDIAALEELAEKANIRVEPDPGDEEDAPGKG